MVKWISQWSSEPLSRVRVLLGAPKSLIKGILADLIIARIFIYDNKNNP